MDSTRVVFIDEERPWQSSAYNFLNKYFVTYIPETVPRNIHDLWPEIKNFNPEIVIIDFLLNASGEVSYNGDEVAEMIHQHNRHLPIIILTSFEENALQECLETKIIREKALLTDYPSKLLSIINANIKSYKLKKDRANNFLFTIQKKINDNIKLSDDEITKKFEAELFLSELDLDNSCRKDLITSASNRNLETLINLSREFINACRKK